MLSDREQRALEELERSLAGVRDAPGAGRPPARPPRVWLGDRPWVLVAVAAVGAASVFLMITGAGVGGLALAVAGGLGWLLRRYWPWLSAQGVLPWNGDEATVSGSGAVRAPRRPGMFQRSAD